MKVHLGGHLNYYEAQRRSNFEIEVSRPTLIVALAEAWGVPAGEIFLAVVNGVLVDPAVAVVVDADWLSLYPPIGGGSAAGVN